MPLPVKNTAPPRELAPAGNHSAVCIGHYHIGTQQTPFGEKEQLVLTFVIDEKRSDGKSFFVSTNPLTVSFDERSWLAKYVKSWRGRAVAVGEEFDTASLVDQPCMITVSHGVSKKGNAFASIDSISPLPRGMAPLAYDGNTFDYSPIDPSKPIPEEVPKWIAELIQDSREWKEYQAGGAPARPATNGHAPAPPAAGLASSEPRKLTMAEKGLVGALGLAYPFDDAALDAALEKARANSDEQEIMEAETTLRPLAIPF